MNIQDACTKRINERRALDLARQRADRLERQAKNFREDYAAHLIHAWIARVYSLDLDPGKMAVNEHTQPSDEGDAGIYELTITLDGNTIDTPRGFLVRENTVRPVQCKYDAPELGRFTEFWRALRNGCLVKYDDLIDAVIYVTDAEDSTPPLTEQELDEMFSAQSEMDVR